jgi:predicted aspartyl protease
MKSGLLLTCAALILPLCGCVQMGSAPPPAAVTGAGEIPFSLSGSGGAALVVPVHVNGRGPYSFVLDTGATLTCVDQSLAKELDLPKPVGTVGYGAGLGDSGAVALHRLDTIAVGDASATELTVCAVDLQQLRQLGLKADGLLGLNFLKAFKVTLDFERKVLSLRPAS